MFSESIGYGSRVKNSIVGVLIGIVLSFVSVALLVWNERDAVRQTGAITEIERVATPDVSSESIDESQDGKLVHMNATAKTDDVLKYERFGIQEKAMKLRWETSIYQWKEKKRRNDDKVRYTYSKEWVDEPIDSSSFRRNGYSNEGSAKHFHDGDRQAKDVNFGAFKLTKKLVQQIDAEEKYDLPETVTLDARPKGVVSDGVFYTGTPNDPQIGDERVKVFMVGPVHEATVMAQQTGGSFASYETKVGIPKQILYVGHLTKPEVIGKQRTEAAIRRWMLRGAGFVLSWIGFSLVMGPHSSNLQFHSLRGKVTGRSHWDCGLLTRRDRLHRSDWHRLVCSATDHEHRDPEYHLDRTLVSVSPEIARVETGTSSTSTRRSTADPNCVVRQPVSRRKNERAGIPASGMKAVGSDKLHHQRTCDHN